MIEKKGMERAKESEELMESQLDMEEHCHQKPPRKTAPDERGVKREINVQRAGSETIKS